MSSLISTQSPDDAYPRLETDRLVLRALLKYGFVEMGLNRAEATTHVENRQTQRVLEKLGFQWEGVLRAYYLRGNAYTDQTAFSLLRNESNE